MTGDVVHRLGAVVVGAGRGGLPGLGWSRRRRRERRVRRRIEALLAVRVRTAAVAAASTAVVGAGAGWLPLGARGHRLRPGRRGDRRAWSGSPGRTACGAGSGAASPRADAEDRLRRRRQLPLAADLLAACISAGAGPREAAEAVGSRWAGRSASGWRGRRRSCGSAVNRPRPGGGSGRYRARRRWPAVWSGPTPPGLPAAEPVSRLAERFRADRARAAAARGRRAQVLVTAPVGLCFLPAFLAVGVAPVVIGLADGLLDGN